MNSDFKDLLKAFSDAGVRYLVVGGWAYTEHVEPRYTMDLDLWIDRSGDNAARVLMALREFGAPLKDLSIGDLTQPGTFYQIGLPPTRIDIITELDGVDFGECWERRTSVTTGDLMIDYISPADLLMNKERTGRPQDLIDAEHLRQSLDIKNEDG